jgi:predicted RNase H-like HicB family nuclease
MLYPRFQQRLDRGRASVENAGIAYMSKEITLRKKFTAVIERDGQWYIAYCPEIPEANGQGRTAEECLSSLTDAIKLILEDRRENG